MPEFTPPPNGFQARIGHIRRAKQRAHRLKALRYRFDVLAAESEPALLADERAANVRSACEGLAEALAAVTEGEAAR